jgi:hypothetical protein
MVHALPVAQGGQVPPPQSTSVSAPFFTPSVQLGAAHVPLVQVSPPAQSLAMVHALPVAQGGQVPPPQSTSVSAPSFTPSVQLAAAHTPWAQTPLWHWEAELQAVPSGHWLEHDAPPWPPEPVAPLPVLVSDPLLPQPAAHANASASAP